MDFSSITTVIASLTSARELGVAALGVRDFNQSAAAIAQINEKLLAAQQGLLMHNAMLLQLQQDHFETAQELRVLKEAAAQQARYPLIDLGDGVFAYRVDVPPQEGGTSEPSATQVVHHLCQPCWDGGKRSVLQRHGQGLKCPLCETFFYPKQGVSRSGYSIGGL
jgi:hypothetical protein